jgi:hypothetical protein
MGGGAAIASEHAWSITTKGVMDVRPLLSRHGWNRVPSMRYTPATRGVPTRPLVGRESLVTRPAPSCTRRGLTGDVCRDQ